MEKYAQQEEIGEGGSGARVYRATRRSDGCEVALKRFRGVASTPSIKHAAETEAAMLQSLQHRNVLPLFEWFFDGMDICLVTPLAVPGSAPFTDAAPRLAAAAVAHVASEVSAGLEYLHSKSILHRDIKPQNLFLVGGGASLTRESVRTAAAAAAGAGAGSGAGSMPVEPVADPTCPITAGTVLLGDFGTAKVLESTRHGYSAVGTKPYMAPEVLRDEDEPYDASADIWSLGATLLALSTGHQVAFALDDRKALKRGKWTLDGAIAGLPEAGKAAWEGLGEPLREVISACLRLDPAARPTAAALGAFPAVAAARAAAEQLARAAAQRLALSETETRLAGGSPCTAQELVCWLQARAGCDDPSMRARVRGDDGTLLQALRQLGAAAATAGADAGDATLSLLALLDAQLATAAVPASAGPATAPGRTSSEKTNHTTVLVALTGALDATSTGPMAATTLASLRAAGDRALRSLLAAVRCIARADNVAAADLGTSPSGLAVAGASAPAPIALVAAPVVAGVYASGSRSVALPSTPAATPGLPAAAPLPSKAEVSAANAALREALSDATGEAMTAALHRFVAEATPAAVAAVGMMDLRRCGLKDAHAEALAAALPQFSGLRSLILGGNNIGAAGAGALAVALPHLTQLQELYLHENGIGDAGAAALAVALPHLTQLQDLVLDKTSIGDAGAAALAVALPHLTQLQELHLYENGIGDAGAAALAVALPHLSRLRELHLDKNGIGDAGAAALAVALPRVMQLQQLGLSGNRISGAAMTAVKAACCATCRVYA